MADKMTNMQQVVAEILSNSNKESRICESSRMCIKKLKQ